MATVSELRNDRFETAEFFERLLDDLVGDAVSQISAFLADPDEQSHNESILLIEALFTDIENEYFDAYEEIAQPIIDMLNQQGFIEDTGDAVSDMLDDMKDEHIALLDSYRRDWIDRVSRDAINTVIPGVESEAVLDYIQRTSDEFENEIIKNTDIYHRVLTDLVTGAMLVEAGSLILNNGTGNWKYTYVGPRDDRNRPHCSQYAGQTLSRTEINGISSSQLILAGNDPAVTPSYITTPCRHNWELVAKE